jgi:NADH:ubiquinone oxidoreductase subunit E
MKPELKKSLERWTTEYPYPIMGLIEAMREVQEKELHISPEAEAYLAQLFKTTVTHVHGVATFFPYFTQEKTGQRRIGLCHGLSCAMAGADKAAKCLEQKLGVEEKVTTKDGRFSWEEMECLGACEQAPALQVNEELKGKATEALIEKLVGEGR